MRVPWINDAKDRFKKKVLRVVQLIGRPLHVLPMTTDPGAWTEEARAGYRSALGLGDHVSIDWRNGSGFSVSRERLQVTRRPECDVFLDPDTGIVRPSWGRSTYGAEWVHLDELELLLAESDARVAVVYQHNDRSGRFPDAKLAQLLDFHRFAGYVGEVGFLFVAQDARALAVYYAALTPLHGEWALSPVLDAGIPSTQT